MIFSTLNKKFHNKTDTPTKESWTLDWEKKQVNKSQKDKSYFEPLYRYYKPKIYSYILNKVNLDKNTAEDLTSITFEKALKGLDTYVWQGLSFSAWLYRIAGNTVIDHYRTTNNKPLQVNTDNLLQSNENIELDVIEFDFEQRIKTLISKLPKRERQVIILKFYEGLTNQEIANKLNISETNTSTILYRIMKKLRIMITFD